MCESSVFLVVLMLVVMQILLYVCRYDITDRSVQIRKEGNVLFNDTYGYVASDIW